MALTFQKLHPCFAAAVSPIDLRQVHEPATLAEIRAGMDEYAVLVFHDQPFTDEEQLAFARRLDGELHTKTGARVLVKSRLGNEAVGDISNLDEDGGIVQSGDRRRMYSLGNRLWHTDASFQDPPGRYSMLSAKVVPSVGADTEFADTRAAYAALDAEMKARLEHLRVHHSISRTRGGRSASSSPPTRRRRSRARSTRSSARCRARTAARSTSPRTPRGSSTGRCRRDGCSCTTSSSTPPSASSSTVTPGASATW